MALKRTVAPTEYPVSLNETKAHLRYTGSAEDPDIMVYIQSAVDQLDGPNGILNRALCTQTIEYTLDRFPSCPIDVPLPPMQSVSSIVYLDNNGDSQTLATTEYRVLNASNPQAKGRIELGYGKSWPATRDVEQAVTITAVCGFGARNAVPEHIRTLIKTMVKEMYDNREAVIPANVMRSPAFQGLLMQATYPVAA